MSALGPAASPDSPAELPGASAALAQLRLSRWAASALTGLDRERTRAIAGAVATAAAAAAAPLARALVAATGSGLVSDKQRLHATLPAALLARFGAEDHCGARLDPAGDRIVVPRPFGVIAAFAPSANPIAFVYASVLCALLTRNAIIVVPSPQAGECVHDAVARLAAAASSVGAPRGAIQALAQRTPELDALLAGAPEIDLLVYGEDWPATAGEEPPAAATSATSSSNVPAIVDASADLDHAAACLVDSKAFDNSTLPSSESTVIVDAGVAAPLLARLQHHGARLLDDAERARISAVCFPDGRLNRELAGQDAATLARAAQIDVAGGTRVLVAEFDFILSEQPLAQPKPMGLLGLVRVAGATGATVAARALLASAGWGHSAVVHCADPAQALAYGAALPVARVTVNAPGASADTGIAATLIPTAGAGTGTGTGDNVGTGFVHELKPSDLTRTTAIRTHELGSTELADDDDPLRPPPATALPSPLGQITTTDAGGQG